METKIALQGLRAREILVLELLLNGKTYKEIMSALGISKSGVTFYMDRIYRHFDVNSRAELLAKHVRFKVIAEVV